MSNKKGMIYTTFAIIGTTVLLILFGLTSGSYSYEQEKTYRIGESSQYLEGVESNLGRAHYLSVKGAGASLVNYTVENSESVDDVDRKLRNITLKGPRGEFNTIIANSSLNDWGDKVTELAEDSRYRLNIDFNNLEFDDSGIYLETNLSSFMRLEDPATSVKVNKSVEKSIKLNFTGYKDTMIFIRSDDNIRNEFKRCGFDDPINNVENGTDYNGTVTYGKATKDVSATDRGEKVLINNQPENGEDFAGVVTDDSVSYDNTKYITGVNGDNLDVSEGQNLILYEDQVWHSRIRKIREEGCYMRSITDTTGPGIMERLRNDLTAREAEGQGLETILNKSELPASLQDSGRSNIGYQYFKGENGDKIAGLTGDKAFNDSREGYISSFRLDTQHVDQWGIQGLTY